MQGILSCSMRYVLCYILERISSIISFSPDFNLKRRRSNVVANLCLLTFIHMLLSNFSSPQAVGICMESIIAYFREQKHMVECCVQCDAHLYFQSVLDNASEMMYTGRRTTLNKSYVLIFYPTFLLNSWWNLYAVFLFRHANGSTETTWINYSAKCDGKRSS